jgi:hypothetical protein
MKINNKHQETFIMLLVVLSSLLMEHIAYLRYRYDFIVGLFIDIGIMLALYLILKKCKSLDEKNNK